MHTMSEITFWRRVVDSLNITPFFSSDWTAIYHFVVSGRLHSVGYWVSSFLFQLLKSEHLGWMHLLWVKSYFPPFWFRHSVKRLPETFACACLCTCLGVLDKNSSNRTAVSSLFSTLLKNDSPSGWGGCLAPLSLPLFPLVPADVFLSLFPLYVYIKNKKTPPSFLALVSWVWFCTGVVLLLATYKWKRGTSKTKKRFLTLRGEDTHLFLFCRVTYCPPSYLEKVWWALCTGCGLDPTCPIGFRELDVTCYIQCCFHCTF